MPQPSARDNARSNLASPGPRLGRLIARWPRDTDQVPVTPCPGPLPPTPPLPRTGAARPFSPHATGKHVGNASVGPRETAQFAKGRKPTRPKTRGDATAGLPLVTDGKRPESPDGRPDKRREQKPGATREARGTPGMRRPARVITARASDPGSLWTAAGAANDAPGRQRTAGPPPTAVHASAGSAKRASNGAVRHVRTDFAADASECHLPCGPECASILETTIRAVRFTPTGLSNPGVEGRNVPSVHILCSLRRASEPMGNSLGGFGAI